MSLVLGRNLKMFPGTRLAKYLKGIHGEVMDGNSNACLVGLLASDYPEPAIPGDYVVSAINCFPTDLALFRLRANYVLG
jgi:hypothetical protein